MYKIVVTNKEEKRKKRKRKEKEEKEEHLYKIQKAAYCLELLALFFAVASKSHFYFLQINLSNIKVFPNLSEEKKKEKKSEIE